MIRLWHNAGCVTEFSSPDEGHSSIEKTYGIALHGLEMVNRINEMGQIN